MLRRGEAPGLLRILWCRGALELGFLRGGVSILRYTQGLEVVGYGHR